MESWSKHWQRSTISSLFSSPFFSPLTPLVLPLNTSFFFSFIYLFLFFILGNDDKFKIRAPWSKHCSIWVNDGPQIRCRDSHYESTWSEPTINLYSNYLFLILSCSSGKVRINRSCGFVLYIGGSLTGELSPSRVTVCCRALDDLVPCFRRS